VLTQTFGTFMNISAKIPPHRQAENRWVQV
jgi:hypothetical protein